MEGEFLLSFLPLPSLIPFLCFPLRSRAPLNQLGDLGERCKLFQRGPGRSPGQKKNLVHSRKGEKWEETRMKGKWDGRRKENGTGWGERVEEKGKVKGGKALGQPISKPCRRPWQCVYLHNNFTMHVNEISCRNAVKIVITTTNPEAHCTLQSIMYSRSYTGLAIYRTTSADILWLVRVSLAGPSRRMLWVTWQALLTTCFTVRCWSYGSTQMHRCVSTECCWPAAIVYARIWQTYRAALPPVLE